MDNCIFCQIITGEIPSTKVYESENVIAFLDIQPVNQGHTLVVLKEHVSKLEDLSEDMLKELMMVVKKVGKGLKEGLEAPGYNVSLNNDPVAGQIIPHVHFHVIPRYENDGLKLWPQEKYESSEQAQVIGEKIKNVINE